MKMVSLEKICDIQIGKTPSRSVSNYWNGSLPWVTISDLGTNKVVSETKERITPLGAKESGSKLIQQGTLLLSFKLSLGKRAFAGCDLFTNEAIAALSIFNKKEIDSSYLFWILGFLDYDQLVDRAAKGKTLNKAKLKKIKIPLPPLAEQKRIAAILDAADALRAKRRESLALLDTLLQSTFLDMFGDPVTNPKGWDVGRLSDVVERLEGGKNVAPSEKETTYKILKVSAVTSGEYQHKESKFLPEEIDFSESCLVKAGDFLISRANTTELIGATAYVWKTPDNIVLPDKIWRLVWKKNIKSHPLFIYQFSKQAEFRRMLAGRASGTSGSMKNIAKPKLLSLPILLPPLELQQKFAAVVESIEAQKERMRSHLAELDALFASLQHRAFRGEL